MILRMNRILVVLAMLAGLVVGSVVTPRTATQSVAVSHTPPTVQRSAKPPQPVVQRAQTRVRTTATPVPHKRPPARRPTAPQAVRLSPVTAYHSQATVDRCKLVLWDMAPPIIAGHNTCGGRFVWNWLDDLAVGRRVIVTSGPAQGTYQVYGHCRVDRKSGPYPSCFNGAGLVLQTCMENGISMGFSLARKVG